MLKPASLRAALECALPELAANPDRLIIYIDEGRIHSRYGDSLSFEYRYRLNVVMLDYAHHASAAIVPLLAWLRVHQPEIGLNPDLADQAVTFEAEILNHSSMDFALRLQLSERVIVTQDPATGETHARHVGEPDPAGSELGAPTGPWELVFVKPDTATGFTMPTPAPV